MKSKTTFIWFLLAAALFAGIWASEHYFQPAPPVDEKILAGFRASEVTGIKIIPNGAREINAAKTNAAWQLEKPIAYPAQTARIEALLDALQKLTPAQKFTPADLRTHPNADAEYGFENPQFSVDIATGGQQWHLRIGNKTAPGDQVFVRITGANGAFVTDAAWLNLLPRAANDWRDTALVNATENFDWLIITNGAKVIELRADATNHLWRMIRPLSARADGSRIVTALQQLRTAQAARFVSDDAKADLTTFGLQPAELDVWLGRGTNLTAALHAGKSSTENPAQLFARREGWNSVIAVGAEALLPWRCAVNDFRDPHLLELTAPVAEIEVAGENHFILQNQGTNGWTVAGEKFSADMESVVALVKLLASLRVTEFVKDVVTPTDLQSFGLATPARQITLRRAAGDTNHTIAQILFGTGETNRVFVKRADEDFIYAIAPTDLNRLPENAWEFRNRRVWNFSETNVASVTLHQYGQMRQMTRTGENKWSITAGTGIINPPAIEETIHRLGELDVAGWVGRNLTAPEKYGLGTSNLQITVELKGGEKKSVDFGMGLAETSLAAVTLEGERWAFVFPAALHQFVALYLQIPPPPAQP